MKLLQLLVEKIKSFFNSTEVVAEVKVIQPKPAAIKKQEKPAEVAESTSEALAEAPELPSKKVKAEVAPEPAIDPETPVIDPSLTITKAPVVEEAPKKSKRKYYHKRKPKAK